MEFLDYAIPGMVNTEQLMENVGAVGKKIGWSDRKTIYAYNAIRDRYCVATCRSHVDINAVNRTLMYCEGYCDFELGRQTYCALNDRMNGLSCLACSLPSCHCVNGIRIEERMKYAHTLFA